MTSTCTLSSISSIPKSKIPINLENTEHDEIFGHLSSAFQGPKLESSNLRYGKSGSHGDLLSVEAPPRFSETKPYNDTLSNINH